MGRMNDLAKREWAGQNLKLAVVAVFCSFVFCSAHSSLQDSKGVKPLEVKKDGERIILYEGSYALLIGISKYHNWPDLEMIQVEFSDLEKSLKKQHGFIVEKSFNPTSEILKKTIDTFINDHGFEKNNRLLIFFSGHGYTRKDNNGKIIRGYIVPSDAVDPFYDEIKFAQKAIDMDQIRTWAKRIESKHALFVFDSCFSGAIFISKNLPIPPDITYLTGKPVRQFITAGSAGEEVPGRSFFTPCFVKGIEGEADYDGDDYITGTDLGIYLRKKIMEYNIDQTPQFGKIKELGLDQGDFVFILKKPIEITPPSPEETLCSELGSEGLIEMIRDAEAYYRVKGDHAENEALRLYRSVIERLSERARIALNQELLKIAEKDYKEGHFTHALLKYYALFKGICKNHDTH